MKKLKLFSILFVLITGLIFLVGCGDDDKVIAVVNGDNIYQSEFDGLVTGLFTSNGVEPTEDQKKQMYDSLITSKLIEQECARLDISVSDNDVQKAIDDIAAQSALSTEELYERLNESYGYSEDYIKSLIRDDMELAALEEYIYKDVKELSDEEYEAIYDANPDKFKKVKVSHILVMVDSDTDDATAKAKALDLISQLNSGADFASLAKENSDDGSASVGGVLEGYIKADNATYVSEFVDGAVSLEKTGDYTKDPVLTQYGYHIIKADDVLSSYTDLKNDVKEATDTENNNKAYISYIEDLRDDAEIEDKMEFSE